MPVIAMTAATAFENMRDNPYANWPRADDPDSRFGAFADPAFTPRFLLEPGQRIFTIGSCFARNVEWALARRGFDIPALQYSADATGDREEIQAGLNNYIPAAIAPQIEWAFGERTFDIDIHGVEVGRGRYLDLQLGSYHRPVSAPELLQRREKISGVYRSLASCEAVIITLGLVEAWFDKKSGIYVNAPPLRGVAAEQPDRFELHILQYEEVIASLRDLIALLGRVCPPGHRIIMTVSPVPLIATFTTSDVAVANSYSKAVLRAAVGALVEEYDHLEYFPSYESVTLSDRSVAFQEDLIHVSSRIVRFNVDRMIRKYVRSPEAETAADIIGRAEVERRDGRPEVALRILQGALGDHADDRDLVAELARMLQRAGNHAASEKLLLGLVAQHNDLRARLLLARQYNETGRYQEAAEQAEAVAQRRASGLGSALQRAIAYYHLGRDEEGLAVLESVKAPSEQLQHVLYWKARFSARLGRAAEADALFLQCTALEESPHYMAAYAEFLIQQGRLDEAQTWIDRAVLAAPEDPAALQVRAELRALRQPSERAPEEAPGSAAAPDNGTWAARLWRSVRP